jgi:hypothetical protein
VLLAAFWRRQPKRREARGGEFSHFRLKMSPPAKWDAFDLATVPVERLLKSWIAEAGLDPKKYGIGSLRRTKALHILNGTGDIRDSPDALGPHEDRVHSAFLTHRRKIRPDLYFSSLRYLISAHIRKVAIGHGCDATPSTYRPQYLSKQTLQ